MKRQDREHLDAMARRNESDLRMVGGIVGVLSGGFLGFAILTRLFRYSHHVPVWIWIVMPFVAAVIGGAVGFFKDTWRS